MPLPTSLKTRPKQNKHPRHNNHPSSNRHEKDTPQDTNTKAVLLVVPHGDVFVEHVTTRNVIPSDTKVKCDVVDALTTVVCNCLETWRSFDDHSDEPL